MEEKENTSTPASNETPASTGVDKTVMIAVVVLLVVAVGGFAFWFSRQSQPSPTVVPFETSTPEESPTPSGSPTATPKPTKTPKPTPVATATPTTRPLNY